MRQHGIEQAIHQEVSVTGKFCVMEYLLAREELTYYCFIKSSHIRIICFTLEYVMKGLHFQWNNNIDLNG